MSIDQGFEVKNSGIFCLAVIFNLSNLIMTILHEKIIQGFLNMTSHVQFLR